MGGSESIVMRGIEEAIARCLGVPAEQDPAELEQAVTVILTAAARMTVQGIWLRARSHALAQVADTEAQVARAQMAWQAARDRVSRTGEFAARASGTFVHFLPQNGEPADGGLLMRSLNVFLWRCERLGDEREALAGAERALVAGRAHRAGAQEYLAAVMAALAVLPATGVTVE